jgi:D-alanine-D-alanine ligase
MPQPASYPVVVKPANQGSSIGASRVEHAEELQAAMDRSFFARRLGTPEWQSYTQSQRVAYVREMTDIRTGIGLPVMVDGVEVRDPDGLLKLLEESFAGPQTIKLIESTSPEREVIIEEFITGKEFSCIVIRGEGADGQLTEAVALPPTEIRKGSEIYDYRSKYLAGLSRKVTPIDLPTAQIEAIRRECERLFEFFGFHVYARIDGFVQSDGTVYLNDPNTTSGMMPSSFFFHQAAEIGLNPSQFLTYIIRCSLAERMRGGMKEPDKLKAFLGELDTSLADTRHQKQTKTRIGVVLGGYSSERHISVESGRNIYEKLSASTGYLPVPIFLKGTPDAWELWQLPINMLLKDNADDIAEKIEHHKPHVVVERIKQLCGPITAKYSSVHYTFSPLDVPVAELRERIDFAFIALHGRPGEDGALQRLLEDQGVPYNGSGPESSQITIDKYLTNSILAQNGFKVARQLVVSKDAYANEEETIENIGHDFGYPLIAKPVDDGCSAAVKRINNEEELDAFARTIFRDDDSIGADEARILKLKLREEFPVKQRMLVEDLIERGEAEHFLEVTGGMLVRPGEPRRFEVFEPSETLTGNEVLSLEEKFLAGEGQNITPARFSPDPTEDLRIATAVKAELKRAADVLGVEGYCRIDAFVRIFADGRVDTVIIEVNSLPGMTPATCIFHQAALSGYRPIDFIEKIIGYGFERQAMRIPT